MRELFAPFVQADASTTRRFGGTGLGLTRAQGIIGRLGGRIIVAHGDPRVLVQTVELPLG